MTPSTKLGDSIPLYPPTWRQPVLEICERSNIRDFAKLLDGILLGTLACIFLYTLFGLFLVRIHADILAAKMELFLRHDMRPLIAPEDPYLQSFGRQLASALFFGIPLGALAGSMAAIVSLIPWARGRWGMPVEPLLTLLLIPACLSLIFSGDAPVLSVLWAVLTPLFFWIPWIAVQRLRAPKKRNRLRLAFFALLFLLPLGFLNTLSSLGVRNLLLGSPVGNRLINFYYDHTLLAAQVIKPPVHQTQKAVAVPEGIRISEPLPCGTLLIKHPDPCALEGLSLVVSDRRLSCPAYILSPGEAEESGQIVLRKASKRFDRNHVLRRGIRWFFKIDIWLALIFLILRFVTFLEDLFERRKEVALLLLFAGLLLPARGFYDQYLLHALQADPNKRARAYASSGSATKRYLSVVHGPAHLTNEELTLLSQDPNPRVRHYAFVAMGLAMNPELLPALRKGMSDPEQIVRTKVYQALGRMKGENALAWVDQAIEQDESWYARHYAYQARCDIERIYKIVDAGDTAGSALADTAPRPREVNPHEPDLLTE